MAPARQPKSARKGAPGPVRPQPALTHASPSLSLVNTPQHPSQVAPSPASFPPIVGPNVANAATARDKLPQSQQIANGIIGAGINNPHIVEERNQNVDDRGVDEEDKYSSVVRMNNAYVPGARRTGALSPVGNAVKPDSSKLAVNGPDGTSVVPSKTFFKSPSPVPSGSKPANEIMDSAINEKQPLQQVPDSFRRGVDRSLEKYTQSMDNGMDELSAGLIKLNQMLKAAVSDSHRETADLIELSQMLKADHRHRETADLIKFSQSFKLNKPIPDDLPPTARKDEEKQRAIKEISTKDRLQQKRQALIKSDMDKQIADLVKFSQSLKLNKPVPDDLQVVPIARKGELEEKKQQAIKDISTKDAASAQARNICASLPPGISPVQALIQSGPEITGRPELVRTLLGHFNISPPENRIADIMSTLARTVAGGTTIADVDVDLYEWLAKNMDKQPAVWPVILWVAFQVKARYSPLTSGPPDIDSFITIIESKADQHIGLWQWDDTDEQLLRQTFISQDSRSSSWIDRYPSAWRQYIYLAGSQDWARLKALTYQTYRPRFNPSEYDTAIRVWAIVLWALGSSNSISESQETDTVLTLDEFVAGMVENRYMVCHVSRLLPQRFISCILACLLRKFSGDKQLNDFRTQIDGWKMWNNITCLVNFRSVLRKTFEFSKLSEELPKSMVNFVIQTDINCICAQIDEILHNSVACHDFFNARDDDAQQLLDLLQDLLDYPLLDSRSRPVFWKAMRKLSKKSNQHPRCFAIPNFQLDGSPVTGGAFADIWKCRFQNETVCVKAMRVFEKSDVEALLKGFRKEALLWRQLGHPNLLPFFGVYYVVDPRRRLCLVSPWMENGNVYNYLQQNPDGINRLTLVLDVAMGLEHLHSLKFVHGDLKAINVLVARSGRAVLTDFGLSTVVMDSQIPALSSTRQSDGGTLRWQAPELLQGGRNSVESDVYAFACVCYEIFTGKIPFHEVNERAIVWHIVRGNIPQISSSISDDVWTLMKESWDAEPKKRPSAEEIVVKLRDLPIGAIPTNAAPDWDPLYTAKFRSTLQEHTLSFSWRED